MGALKKPLEQIQPSKLIVCTPEELQALVRVAVRAEMGDRQQAEELPEYMTTQQVADLLQTSTRNVRYMVTRKELRATRLGEREYRFARPDVLEYLDQQRQKAGAGA